MVVSSTPIAGYEISLKQGTTDVIDQLTPEWTRLCAEGPCNEPFYYPAWVSAYSTEFEPDTTTWLLVVRCHGTLRAILPFTLRSMGVGPMRLRVLRSAANSHFPRFDVVHGAGDEQAIARIIWHYLQGRKDWDLLQFESAPEGSVVWRLLELAKGADLDTRYHKLDATPYIDLAGLAGDVDDIISSHSKNQRHKLRRSMKRLRARGDINFSIVDHTHTSSEIEAAVQAFYKIEASGWKGRANTAILSDGKTRRFYDRIVDAAIASQTLMICLLRCDGHLVAAGLKCVWNGTIYELKSGYDEAYSDSSPGHIIKAYTVVEALRMGINIVDIGGRSDPHKLAWTKLSRPFATCFVGNRTVRGRVAWMALFRLGPLAREKNVPTPAFIKRMIE